MSESDFHPVSDDCLLDRKPYTECTVRCPCEAGYIYLTLLDSEPYQCRCGRQYRLIARVEVDDSTVKE